MTIENIIAEGVVKAVKELYGADLERNLSLLRLLRKEFEGDLTVVVFPLLKISRKAPDATATEIGEWIVEEYRCGGEIQCCERRFLNIIVSPAFWLRLLHEILQQIPISGNPPRRTILQIL